MPNKNCLEGISCPKCGYERIFWIYTSTGFLISDNGEVSHGDVEWNQDSTIVCDSCGHRGTVKEFSIKGDFREIANKLIGDLADFQREIAIHSRDGEWDTLQAQLDLLEEEIKKARKSLPRVRCIAEK